MVGGYFVEGFRSFRIRLGVPGGSQGWVRALVAVPMQARRLLDVLRDVHGTPPRAAQVAVAMAKCFYDVDGMVAAASVYEEPEAAPARACPACPSNGRMPGCFRDGSCRRHH